MGKKIKKETKTFSKQIKRYAKVGGVLGSLATELASQKYLGIKINKSKHATKVKNSNVCGCNWTQKWDENRI